MTNFSIVSLDPQMKDYIHSGGNLRVIVASDNHEEVNAIKEAFHSIFGLATVYGLPSPPNRNVAVQPVGFAAAKSSGLEKLDSIRDTHPEAKEDGTILTGFPHVKSNKVLQLKFTPYYFSY